MGDDVAGEKKSVARNTGGPRTSQSSGSDGRVSLLAGKISFLFSLPCKNSNPSHMYIFLPLGILVELLEEIKASEQQSNEKQQSQEAVYFNLTLAGSP